jgi:hypothetical protein
MKTKQTLDEENPGIDNLAYAMHQQTAGDKSDHEGESSDRDGRTAARQRKKQEIDKAITEMIPKALETVGKVVSPVVNQVVTLIQQVAEDVSGVVQAGAEVLQNSRPETLNSPLVRPAQTIAEAVPFTEKYPITYSSLNQMPVSESIDQLTRNYYQLYVLRNLNDYTQVWGPQDEARLAAETAILTLQKDVIDYYFNKTAQESQTGEGAQNFLKEMQGLIENSEGRPENEIQNIYRLYLEASSAVYQRHVLNETLSANARQTKTLKDVALAEIRQEIASIARRESELTRLRETLTTEFTNAVDKTTDEMDQNRLERSRITLTLNSLARSKRIYETLSRNETINPQSYEYLRDHEISPNHQHEKNLHLLELAKMMIALQPGYEEIERRAKAYLEDFTARSLRAFIATLGVHIAAVSDRVTHAQEIDVEKNLPLLKLYMLVLKSLVPDLPVVAIQGMIHYDKQDFDVLALLRGDFNDDYTLFQEISDAFNQQIDRFKETIQQFINKTVGLINDDIGNYLREPTGEIAARIVKRLTQYHEFFSDYLLISNGDSLENLTEFTVDDFNTADARDVLNALINRYKTAITSHVSRIKFGTNNESLDFNVNSLMLINQAVQSSDFQAQKNNLTRAFKEISMIAKAKSASAIQRLGMVESHKISGGLKEALYFNRLFRVNIANKLNLPWESQEKLLLKIMGRLAVNTNLMTGVTFYETLVDALVDSGVNVSLAKFHYKSLPLVDRPEIKRLNLDEHLPADAPFQMTAEMNAVVLRVIDNHPEIDSLDFGRFIPSNELFASLINDYENIGYYYFELNSELNPKIDLLDKNETVNITIADDIKVSKTVYYRSRKALLSPIAPQKTATQELNEAVKEDFKIAKEKANDLREKGKKVFNQVFRKGKQGGPSDLGGSGSASSSAASLIVNSPAPAEDLYPQFLSALIDHGMSPSRLRQMLSNNEIPWETKFHPFMLRAYKELKMSFRTAIEMRELALDDNHEAAYQWLAILKELVDPRPYIRSAHDFFLSIDDAEAIASSIEYLQQFADSVLEDFAELKPADYVSQISTLLRKLDLASTRNRDVLIKLFRAYVLSRDLLNDYNNQDVLNQHFAFINSLLAIQSLRENVLDVLVNQFIFSSLYSAETLRRIFPNPNLSLHLSLVSHLEDRFLWDDFSDDALMFGNHLRILMNNPNLISNWSVQTAFVRGLAHYISAYSSDVDFPNQLHVYVEYLKFNRIPLTPEQALSLLTPINAMSKTKWRNNQEDLASLVSLFPNADTHISKALFEALENYERMAEDYRLAQTVSLVQRDLEHEDWVVQEDVLPIQLKSLPLIAQNTYRYFTSKLNPGVTQANLKLAKQLKKLDIIVRMLEGLLADPAPLEDPCDTARNALASLGFFSAGNTAIYRFVNTLEASGMLGDPAKIITLREMMKTHLYDLILRAFIDRFKVKERALITTLPAVDQALAEVTQLNHLLDSILTVNRSAPHFGASLLARLQVVPAVSYPRRLFTKISHRPNHVEKLLSRLSPMLVENVTLDSVRAMKQDLVGFRAELENTRVRLREEYARTRNALFLTF